MYVCRYVCMYVPRLPRKVPRRHARLNRAQGRHLVPWVPQLPRKTTVDVRWSHTCHAKRRWMSPSATPATQSAAASRATKPGPSAPPSAICATGGTPNDGRCEFLPRLPPSTISATPATQKSCVKLLCVKVSYVKLLYVKFVCVVIVCERWYVGGSGRRRRRRSPRYRIRNKNPTQRCGEKH